MSSCELCGKQGNVIPILIEGTELKVCSICAKHGTVKDRPNGSFQRRSYKTPSAVGPEYRVIENIGSLLREVREKKNLTNEDFAKILTEKESIVAKWEQGSIKPSIDTAKKIGRILGLQLVEKDDNKSDVKIEKEKRSDELTLGDFIKVRKRV